MTIVDKGLVPGEAYPKAQIDPHLIFNSLNFIYNSVLGVSQKAAHAVLLLSEILQYNASANEPDGKADLAKEIRQVINIIDLNEIRFNSKLYIDTRIDAALERSHLRIPPMLLCTLVENVFKHGMLTLASSPGLIEILLNGRELHFRTVNLKRPSVIQQDSTKTGVATVRNRLDWFYTNQYELNIEEDADTFRLILKVML